MNSIRHLLFGALSLGAFTGCAHHVGFHSAHIKFRTEPEYAQPSEIPIYGTKRLSYSVYYGSDKEWHYFETLKGPKLLRYKVPRFALNWTPVFPVGSDRLFVERNWDGQLQPIPPEEPAQPKKAKKKS